MVNLSTILTIKKDNSSKKASCKSCPYFDRTFVPSYIGEPGVVLVGEAPGAVESSPTHLTPFVGESGQLLRKVLREVGFDDTKISFCNTCACHPPSNEQPQKKAQDLCVKSFLFPQIQELHPKLVILAGSVALNTFFPKESITEKAGNLLSNGQYRFIPVLHPAYCLRNPTSTPRLRKDLKKAYQFVNGTLSSNKQYTLVNSFEKLEEARKVLLNEPLITFDTETNGKVDVFDPDLQLWTVGFGYERGKAYCFPYDHPELVNIPLKEAIQKTVKEICESNVKKVAHNAIFDIMVLMKFGIILKNLVADTMVMAFLLDENRYSIGLKQLSSEYLEGYIFAWSEKLSELAPYNCEDCDNTLGLFELFLPQIKQHPKMLDLLKSVIVPMLQVIVDMEMLGVYISPEVSQKLSKTLKNKLEGIREAIEEKFPKSKGVNLSSPKQVGELLFTKLGYPVIKRSEKTKVPSTDDDSLTSLSRQKYKLANYLLKIREYEKLISTYVDKLPEVRKNDGRVHCSFNICGARTGRISSSNPNLQNIPRDKTVKQMFQASEGFLLLNVDASQAELRIGCSVGQEENMIQAYQEGVDVHKLTASKIWNIPIEQVTENQRQGAKSCNFGYLYGASAEGYQRVAENDYGLKLSLEECIDFRKKWFETYPGFLSWYDRTKEQLRKNGYIEYPTGRFRRFPEVKGLVKIPDDVFRRGVNSPVQGSASDVVLFTMVRLSNVIKKYKLTNDIRIIITVHDSIVLECKPKEVGTVRTEMDNICKSNIPKQFPWLKVPMIFDFAKGLNWGELEKIQS